MKILPQVLTTLFFLLVANACTQDAYDKGEGAYSLMQADLCLAYTNSEGMVDHFVTDGGETHRLKTPMNGGWMSTPDSVYRAALYYTKASDGSGTTINRMGRVGVMTPKFIDDMKTDPLGFESAWISKSGVFLNLGLNVKTGSTTDEDAIQTLGCHIDSLMAYPDSTHAVRLLLYHDQGKVPQYYTQRAFFSISIKNLLADTIYLVINTYDGLIERAFEVER
ncbi:MAG: hypothetical protein J6Z14_00125 [Prevotella sp.]|nr:hypothetical protein [Prevotella sp.]